MLCALCCASPQMPASATREAMRCMMEEDSSVGEPSNQPSENGLHTCFGCLCCSRCTTWSAVTAYEAFPVRAASACHSTMKEAASARPTVSGAAAQARVASPLPGSRKASLDGSTA